MTTRSSGELTRGAPLLLLAAIVALALNLRPAMAAVGPLLDLIETATGMDSTAASLLTTLPVLMIGVGALSIRPLRRRLGERRGILLGALLIGAACLVRVLFRDTASLIASAVVVGVGVALIQALAPVVIKRAFPERFGTVMALYTTGIMGGAAIAAATAAGLAEAIGWAGTLALWSLPAFVAAVVWLTIRAIEKNKPI
ncbi:MFS transporter, partial [Brevundimonas sp.]|uniref:MFS transporter n=1 Tax=Brevundimonas sp. TaxID=1871086 RepID=UPI0025B8C817